jgi:hypothetical protein
MEKISRDAGRVDVERLFDEHKQEPEVSGGYIFKVDRADPGDSGFSAASQNIKYVYPKEVEIERPGRDAQQQYVRRFFSFLFHQAFLILCLYVQLEYLALTQSQMIYQNLSYMRSEER